MPKCFRLFKMLSNSHPSAPVTVQRVLQASPSPVTEHRGGNSGNRCSGTMTCLGLYVIPKCCCNIYQVYHDCDHLQSGAYSHKYFSFCHLVVYSISIHQRVVILTQKSLEKTSVRLQAEEQAVFLYSIRVRK